MDDNACRSWFCVFNNPKDNGIEGNEQEICDKIVELWTNGKPTRSCSVIYCISSTGMHHLHAVLEDTVVMRFSAVKKVFPKMHIEPTRGNKQQAEDYINKKGKYAEKGEKIVASATYGEIKGVQGQRRDFEIIEDMIMQGLTPNQIMQQSFSYRRYDKMIKQAYYDHRKTLVPFVRDIKVFWHVGESGSGKSYEAVKLVEALGEDNVFMVSDYEGGGFDRYNGEQVLFLDEFRGQLRYSVLLSLLQGYRIPIHARYNNVVPLWIEVHITSVLPPELVYRTMVSEYAELDTLSQLFRRLTCVCYHWRDKDGNYNRYDMDSKIYVDYGQLKEIAEWVAPPKQEKMIL